MGARTDAYEIDDENLYQSLGYDMDNRPHDNQPFNGSTKFINFMLSFITLLLASGVGGAFVLSNDVAALKSQVHDLQEKVQLVIEGRIRYPDGRPAS